MFVMSRITILIVNSEYFVSIYFGYFFILLLRCFCSNHVQYHKVSIVCCKVQCAVVLIPHLIPSLQPCEVLHHSVVTTGCCAVQWCLITAIPPLLVSVLLTQALHHREVTIECCPEQWCTTIQNIPRLFFSLDADTLASLGGTIANQNDVQRGYLKKGVTVGDYDIYGIGCMMRG